jgi:AbrB family looped-hinge helix DNA binding protein
MENAPSYFDGGYVSKRYFTQFDFVFLLLFSHSMTRNVSLYLQKKKPDVAMGKGFIKMGIYVGMGMNMGESKVDERGRVTIPKGVREKAGLKPGDHVQVFPMEGGVSIRKTIDLEEFIKELSGCITVEGDLDPLQLKEIWRTAP